MAQFLKNSIFLLVVVGLLAFAEAGPTHDREVEREHKVSVSVKDKVETEGIGSGLGLGGEGGLLAGKVAGAAASAKAKVPYSNFEGNKLMVNMDKVGDGHGGGCQCGSPELKEFMHKFQLLLRTYTSNDLVPELKNMAIKFIDYIVAYLAQEKPDQVGKVHELLQGSADLTGRAVTGGGRHKREAVSLF